MRAAFVAGPKYNVSLPGDPAPDLETVKLLELRYFWRFLTSGLDMPVDRELENVVETARVAGAAGVSGVLNESGIDSGPEDEPGVKYGAGATRGSTEITGRSGVENDRIEPVLVPTTFVAYARK